MIHRAGLKHQADDALPRLPTNWSNTTAFEDDLPLLVIETPNSIDAFVLFVDKTSNGYNSTNAMYVPADTPHETINTLVEPTTAAFIREQEKDTYCCKMTSQVRKPNTKFYIYYHELLVRRSTINSEIQMKEPTSLRQQIQTLAHYPLIAERSKNGGCTTR